MLKFLFFLAVMFLAVRFLNRLFLPSRKRNSQFNPFQGFGNRPRRRNLDDIEDADYEDLTDKDNES